MILAQGEISPATLFVILLVMTVPASLVVSLVALALAFSFYRTRRFTRLFAQAGLALGCLNGIMVALAFSDSHAHIEMGTGSILFLVVLVVAFLAAGTAFGRVVEQDPPQD